jgi:hypothetical protein
MSAINPASFATPTLGLQAPSGIGPGAVGVGRGGSNNGDRRPNHQGQDPQQQPQPQSQQQVQVQAQPQSTGYSGPGQPGRGAFPGSFNPPFIGDRPVGPAAGYPPTNFPHTQQFGNFAGASRPGNAPYVPASMQPLDSYPGAFQQPGDYQGLRSRFVNPQTGGSVPLDQSMPPIGNQNEWAGAFQGLSLNSR